MPYPYAVGEENTYLILRQESIPNSSWIHIPNMDPYTVYYEENENGTPFDNIQIIDDFLDDEDDED